MIEEKENDPETDFPIKTEEDAGLLDFKYKWLVVRKLSIRRKKILVTLNVIANTMMNEPQLGYCARIEVYCTVLSWTRILSYLYWTEKTL